MTTPSYCLEHNTTHPEGVCPSHGAGQEQNGEPRRRRIAKRIGLAFIAVPIVSMIAAVTATGFNPTPWSTTTLLLVCLGLAGASLPIAWLLTALFNSGPRTEPATEPNPERQRATDGVDIAAAAAAGYIAMQSAQTLSGSAAPPPNLPG